LDGSALLLNDDFKSSFELIAFEVTKDEAVDLSEVESDEMISITPLLIPHVDQPINFIQGY